MNKFQGGGNINDVIHIFAATGAKHHQGHGWPGSFPTCPNKIIPDITQQLFTGLEELSQPFFNLLKLGGVKEIDLYSDVLKTTRSRFSWLVLNLMTAIAASLVIGLFQGTIEKIVTHSRLEKVSFAQSVATPRKYRVRTSQQ